MANYATNNFFAQTENEKDLITIEQFIEENFCDNYIARHGQCVESEFYSKWECPEKEMNELISLLKLQSKFTLAYILMSFQMSM